MSTPFPGMDPYLERRDLWHEVHTGLIFNIQRDLSRSWQRPRADVYLFSIRELIPDFSIPLRQGEAEPILPLNKLLHELYDQANYDLTID